MSYNKFPWTNFHGFNLDWVIETVQECKSIVDGIVEEVNNIFENYVTKKDLESNRKLSDKGDFTGTWYQETKSSVDARINNGQNLYQNVIDLIQSNPELNIETFDGGFLASAIIPTVEDLGSITEIVTEEIDCGFFVYPCICTI